MSSFKSSSFQSVRHGAVLLVCAGLAACTSAPQPVADAAILRNVRVEYIHPENFRDVGDRFPDGARARGYLRQLDGYLTRRAALRLAPGQRLQVQITDVDMAGEIEPWRVRNPDLRVVRDIYPPRIDLRFTLMDANGAPIRQGERKLRDPAFQITAQGFRDDPLRYEKNLLDEWLEREFPRGS